MTPSEPSARPKTNIDKAAKLATNDRTLENRQPGQMEG